jgi:uncharacterized protein (DUF488 family)
MAPASCKNGSRIWTIGHSTRTWEAFAAVLRAHDIAALADVRRFPASRKHPHFNREAMEKALAADGVAYAHFPELGGRRKASPGSSNTAWRSESFRGYADYMATPAFRAGMERLAALAASRRTALMCAESVWWRCHRGLIADWLKARGTEVLHIIDESPPQAHPYTGAATIVEGRLSYEGGQPRLI